MAALALFATLSLGAHPALDAPPIASITEALTGTVDALVIEDRIKNATSRYHELQRDDGTTLQLTGAAVDSLDDHRLAMTFAIAGLVAAGRTSVARPASAAISYPGFFDDLGRVAS